MKKIFYILFFISVSFNNIAYAESKLDKIKNKIKAGESATITLSVTNTGNTPVYQVRAISDSDLPRAICSWTDGGLNLMNCITVMLKRHSTNIVA